MKSVIIRLFIILIVLSISLEAEILSTSKVKVQQAVLTFFKLLKNNDINQIKKSLPKDKYNVREELNNWDKWITTWQAYTLIDVGKVEENKYTSKGREKSAKVHVVIEYKGTKSDEKINVSLINGIWMWDEN